MKLIPQYMAIFIHCKSSSSTTIQKLRQTMVNLGLKRFMMDPYACYFLLTGARVLHHT